MLYIIVGYLDAQKILVRQSQGKRLLETHRCRWKDNIKMELREIGCGSVDWIEQAQERSVVGFCKHGY
jgi:hypothetical protein